MCRIYYYLYKRGQGGEEKKTTYMLDYICIKFLWKETQETNNIVSVETWVAGVWEWKGGFAFVVLHTF